MIERYTLKFTPAYSQEDLEKALNDGIDPASMPNLHKMKARHGLNSSGISTT